MAQGKSAAEGVVRLWTVDVESLDPARLLPLLSTAERARAQALSADAPRRRFLAARATLRAGLAELGDAEPASIAFAEGAHGKPELAEDGPLRFNVSHSGGLALVAIAVGREVGVDVEQVRPRARLEAIARRCFSAAEREALEACAEPDRLELFYAVWTAREAFVKATGRGLATASESFEVPAWPAGYERLVPVAEAGIAEARFSLQRLTPAPGYSGALAAGGESWRVERRALPAALAAP